MAYEAAFRLLYQKKPHVIDAIEWHLGWERKDQKSPRPMKRI